MIEASPVPSSSRLLLVFGVLGVIFLVGIAVSGAFSSRHSASLDQTQVAPSTTTQQTPPSSTLFVVPPVVSPVSVSSSRAEIDVINAYWLQNINRLREQEGLRLLKIDPRLVTSATDWATYMGEHELLTHARPDGKTMHQWMDARGLPFTERNSPDGWKQNYFTENIARAFSATDVASLEKALDRTLADFLGEQPGDDAHRRTIYAADWNSVGVGWYVKTLGSGQTQVYFVMHYGSLKP